MHMFLAGILFGIFTSAVVFMVGAVLVYEDKYGPIVWKE